MKIETSKANASVIYASMQILKLNHHLFLKALEGVTEEQARTKINEYSNSFIWIATHTVWAKYNTLNLLANPIENPFKGLFGNFKANDVNDVYPTLEEVKSEWEKLTPLFRKALHAITEEQLESHIQFENPYGDSTLLGAIIFCSHHESYDIGQMAYLRKYFTKEALNWETDLSCSI